MGGAAAQAMEECVELLVILGAGVLAFAEPGPQLLPDVTGGMRADRPALGCSDARSAPSSAAQRRQGCDWGSGL